MWNFLSKAYEVLFSKWLYSSPMNDYLCGFAAGENNGEPVYFNKYVLFWLIAFVVGGVVLPGVYYKIIDRDSWAKLGWWILWGLGGSFLVFISTFAVLWDQASYIGSPLYEYTQLEGGVDMFDCLGVSFAQFLLTLVFYIGFSFLWKRFSYNCRYVPC